MTDSIFDAFGFLNEDIELFVRGSGTDSSWRPGDTPVSDLRNGPTQFNHTTPFQTANDLQLLRDLAMFKDANGVPLFV